MMGLEALFILGQFPFLLSVFVLLEVWYFIYTNLCPFLHRIPYFEQLNPCKACLRIGFHLLPLAKFLALPDDEYTLNEREVYARAAGEESAEELESDDDDSGDEDEDISALGLKHVKKYRKKYLDYSNIKVNMYKVLPLRATSRVWGKVNNVNVPVPLRSPMYRLYSWLFECNLSEALVEDLTHFANLGQLFRRELKPDVRPVNPHHSIVSPCDGRVLHFGKVVNSQVEQVKGVTYSLKTFLGANTWSKNQSKVDIREVSDEDYHTSIGINLGNCLYHCVIYLAPGDYHRFHSPINWNVQYRRHFPGCLLSVNPGIAHWVKGLFSYNERVVLYGNWEHGFFSYTAVGATNVGSISLYFDQELTTNVGGRYKEGSFQDLEYTTSTTTSTDAKSASSSGVTLQKGQCIGEFNLGSTIVLVFEAPKDFEFDITPGNRIQLGEKMGSL